MGKGVKIIFIIIGIVAVLLVIISTSYINHRMELSKEDSMFIPNGELVEVNGHDMHIYTEGHGEETLVFMSGGGTAYPVLDFKTLYSLLSDKYKIVVVEKAGYGFSEDLNISRDIDLILGETRQALVEVGVEGPYILFPHSMSGIEALYWAQEYPDEVKGIVGLDMTVPESYEDYSVNKFMINLGSFGARIGITRFFPAIVNESDAIKNGELSEGEKQLYRTVFYRRTLTKSMSNEIGEIKINAEKVGKNGRPNLPILFFISNGNVKGWDKDEWIRIQESYSRTIKKSKIIKLDSEHSIHNIKHEKIAEQSKKFIEDIQD